LTSTRYPKGSAPTPTFPAAISSPLSASLAGGGEDPSSSPPRATPWSTMDRWTAAHPRSMDPVDPVHQDVLHILAEIRHALDLLVEFESFAEKQNYFQVR
ncbi:hypothetical protein EJB05_08517, partial [Eragrostis curvula]